MTDTLKRGDTLTIDGWTEDQNGAETTPYEFIQVNGFIYRGNKATGEMWRLQSHATDKTAQVWKRVEEPSAT